jgi:hypothetical protein
VTEETLPPSLQRFGGQLERAIARPATRRRPRARRVTGLAVAAAAVAGVAFAIVSGLSSTTQSAWAQRMIARASAALAPPASSRTILHVAATETLSPKARSDQATTAPSISEQSWIQQGAPWRVRTLIRRAGGPLLLEDGQGLIYNTTEHVLYHEAQVPTRKPHYTLRRLADGSYRLSAPYHGRTISRTEAPAQIALLRSHRESVTFILAFTKDQQKVEIGLFPTIKSIRKQENADPIASPTSLKFAATLRALLRSGQATVRRTTAPDGRPAVEFTVQLKSGPRRTDYYADPRTLAPIEIDDYGWDAGDVTRLCFSAYEAIPLAGHAKLLETTVPASARRDPNAADYNHHLLPNLF